MIINRSTMIDIARGFQTVFQKAFDGLGPQTEPIEAIATRVDSTGSEETYSFVDGFPQMREWLGPRVIKSLAAHPFTIRNKRWEATVEVSRDDIEDDKLGLIRPKIAGMAVVRTHLAQLLTTVLEAGFTSLCYDGQLFFDSDHPVAGSTKSNVASAALDTTSFWVGRVAMGGLTDDEGRPLGIIPDICMVGPAKEKAARSLFEADVLASGATNVDKGLCKVVLNPWISGYHWFLFDSKKAMQALVAQIRKDPIFQMVLGSMETDIADLEALDYQVFMQNMFYFGATGRYNVGYGLWQLAYGSAAGS
jgi:phage major head subunit gpT-like protein